jgi:uncharacterized protein YkwD
MKNTLLPNILKVVTSLSVLIALNSCGPVNQSSGSEDRIVGNAKPADQSKSPQKRPDSKPTPKLPPAGPGKEPTTPSPTSPTPPPPSPPSPSEPSECHKASAFICKVETLITSKTNAYRSRQGIKPLNHDSKISFVARDWSIKQSQRNSIGHSGFPSARESVYRSEFGASQRLSGENVAMTSGVRVSGEDDAAAEQIAETFVDMWWNSSGHRANMLRSNFKSIGVGLIKTQRGAWYATQIFQ